MCIKEYQDTLMFLKAYQGKSRYIKIQVNRPDQAMCELEGRNNERAQMVRRPTTSQLLLTYADTLGTILLLSALDIDTDEEL